MKKHQNRPHTRARHWYVKRHGAGSPPRNRGTGERARPSLAQRMRQKYLRTVALRDAQGVEASAKRLVRALQAIDDGLRDGKPQDRVGEAGFGPRTTDKRPLTASRTKKSPPSAGVAKAFAIVRWYTRYTDLIATKLATRWRIKEIHQVNREHRHCVGHAFIHYEWETTTNFRRGWYETRAGRPSVYQEANDDGRWDERASRLRAGHQEKGIEAEKHLLDCLSSEPGRYRAMASRLINEMRNCRSSLPRREREIASHLRRNLRSSLRLSRERETTRLSDEMRTCQTRHDAEELKRELASQSLADRVRAEVQRRLGNGGEVWGALFGVKLHSLTCGCYSCAPYTSPYDYGSSVVITNSPYYDD